MASLSTEQLEDLQVFLKDWLRHAGRTQSDLRRALKAGSIRMPVLLDALQATFGQRGLAGLAAQLCEIEARWDQEGTRGPGDRPGRGAALTDSPGRLDSPGPPDASAETDALGQLDLLLQEIRGDVGSPD